MSLEETGLELSNEISRPRTQINNREIALNKRIAAEYQRHWKRLARA